MLASVVCLCLVFVFGTDQLRAYGLIAVVLGALGTLVWLYLRGPQQTRLEENIWLSSEGLRWTNEHGGDGALARDEMQAFFLGLDPEAMRGLPAMSFVLSSGLESQPIPLAAPATPERVRAFLQSSLDLPEQPLEEVAWIRRTYAALDAGLSWRGASLEAELLRLSLIEPQRQPSGAWRVFRVREFGAIDLLPYSLTFQAETDSGESIDFATLDDAANYILEHVLPEDASAFVEMKNVVDKELTIRHQQAVRADARQAGFFSQCDDTKLLWTFKGPPSALEQIAAALRQAAKDLQPPQMGERPPRIDLAGESMPVTLQVEELAWIGAGVLCGPPRRHRELARTIEERLAKTKPGATFEVEPPNDVAERWILRFHVAEPGYDPGDE